MESASPIDLAMRCHGAGVTDRPSMWVSVWGREEVSYRDAPQSKYSLKQEVYVDFLVWSHLIFLLFRIYHSRNLSIHLDSPNLSNESQIFRNPLRQLLIAKYLSNCDSFIPKAILFHINPLIIYKHKNLNKKVRKHNAVLLPSTIPQILPQIPSYLDHWPASRVF